MYEMKNQVSTTKLKQACLVKIITNDIIVKKHVDQELVRFLMHTIFCDYQQSHHEPVLKIVPNCNGNVVTRMSQKLLEF